VTFQPFAILRELIAYRVEFIVIGGLAAAAHGSPTATVDLDICYRRETKNLERLAGALQAVGARLRGADDDVPFLLDAKTLSAGDHFTLSTDLGDLDILGTPVGTSGFDDLAARASDVDLDGLTVRVVSLEDLIRMKRAAGRPKDRIELEVLGALREELGDAQ
jgi:hypothetical protein